MVYGNRQEVRVNIRSNLNNVLDIAFCIVLYCIVLYCIVLYCIVLYCIVLYCIVYSGSVSVQQAKILPEKAPRNDVIFAQKCISQIYLGPPRNA